MSTIESKFDKSVSKQRARYKQAISTFYNDFNDFSFKNKFLNYQITDTDYAKLIKNYINYDGVDLIKQTIDLIDQTEQKFVNCIGYPIHDFNDFKNQFTNLRSYYGSKISFLSYLHKQMNGDDGENKIIQALTRHDNINVLHNIQLPYSYLKDDGTLELGSTQIDLIVVCKYGVFTFESKNYRVDGISIESGNNPFEKLWNVVAQNSQSIDTQFLHVYKNGQDVTRYNSNIGRQTYIHRQAIIDALANDQGNYFNRQVLDYKVFSSFVYANDDLNGKFYLGNHSNADKISNWYVEGLSIDQCWNWITDYADNSLNDEEVAGFVRTLKNLDKRNREKLYSHMLINPGYPINQFADFQSLEHYRVFLKKWRNFNHRFN